MFVRRARDISAIRVFSYRRVAYLGRVPCVTRENATFRFTHDYNVGQEVNKKPIFKSSLTNVFDSSKVQGELKSSSLSF